MEEVKKEEDQESQVIIEEEVEVVEESFDTEGLLPQEVEMAKNLGLVKEEEEDGTDEEQPKPETSEDTEEKVEEEEEVEEPTFEQVEENEKLIDKYNKNEKALYWRWKSDKQKRQTAQQELEELKSSQELTSLKESVSAKKLLKINEALADPELTVEKLQAIITGQTAQPQEEKTFTEAEFEKIQQEKRAKEEEHNKVLASRFQLTEQIGKTKYEEFDEVVELVQEVIKDNPRKQKLLNQILFDTTIDEADLAEEIYDFAKFSPKFKDLGKKASPEDQEKVGRAIENSKKRRSSASLSSSGKRRAVNEDDLTIDDIPGMKQETWNKLKKSTRDRLLGKPS